MKLFCNCLRKVRALHHCSVRLEFVEYQIGSSANLMKKILSYFLSMQITFIGGLMSLEDYKDLTRNSYNDTAIEYSKKTVKIQPEHKVEKFLSYLSPNDKLLDIGCGPGRDASYFVEKGFDVTGIDISSKMIQLAREEVPNATFELMDIEEMTFPENHFDAVWASASLLHVPKDKINSILKQIQRFVKEGGIIYLSLKKGEGETLTPDHRYGGVKKFWAYYQEEELLSLLKNEGFTVLEHDLHDQSTSYQTHPWISVICKNSWSVDQAFSTRPAQPGEEEVLYNLISELAEYEGNSESVNRWNKEHLTRYGFKKNPYFFTEFAVIDGNVIGYALYYYGFSANRGAPILFLEDLYVKPEFRRRGVAHHLMRKLSRYAEEKECCGMQWNVFDWNASAIEFYKKLGGEQNNRLIFFSLDQKSLNHL